MKNSQFKIQGYFLEYLVDGKFVGTKMLQEPDRTEVGYYSRIDSIADNDIKLDNKRTIKKGTKFYTRMNFVCGKTI